MITVVSLNPSIDRTLALTELRPGQTNRVRTSRQDAGGKGVNVCLHLSALGAKSVRCTGLMRAEEEPLFRSRLEAAGVCCDWLTLSGHVRVNTKICTDDGGLTELNESGEAIPAGSAEALLQRCEAAFSGAAAVVLTGSLPPGLPEDTYARLIGAAHRAGAVCLLDADGSALRTGIQAQPDAVKPNRAELERLLHRELEHDGALIAAARELAGRGISTVCVSLGEQGALFASRSQVWRAPAIPVEVRSAVGAGDAMVAGLALAAEEQLSPKAAFAMAVAAGTAAVCAEGTQPLDLQTYHRALERVQLRRPDTSI